MIQEEVSLLEILPKWPLFWTERGPFWNVNKTYVDILAAHAYLLTFCDCCIQLQIINATNSSRMDQLETCHKIFWGHLDNVYCYWYVLSQWYRDKMGTVCLKFHRCTNVDICSKWLNHESNHGRKLGVFRLKTKCFRSLFRIFYTCSFNDALICSCQEFTKKKFIMRKYGNKCVGNAITMRKVSYKLKGNFTQW